MDRTATYAALGRLLAVVEAATGLHPAALNNCLTAPKSYLMGQYLGRAMAKLRTRPELDAIVSEIMDSLSLAALDGIPDVTPLVDQGTMQVAYYQQRSKLPARKAKSKAPAGVDWSAVKWEGRSDKDIADEVGVTRQAVAAKRQRMNASK